MNLLDQIIESGTLNTPPPFTSVALVHLLVEPIEGACSPNVG
jgi:hypothetical protein